MRSRCFGMIDDVFTPVGARSRGRSRRTRSTSCCCSPRGSVAFRRSSTARASRTERRQSSARSPRRPESRARVDASSARSNGRARSCRLARLLQWPDARRVVRATRLWSTDDDFLATDNSGSVHQHASVARLSRMRRAWRLPRSHTRQDLRDAWRRRTADRSTGSSTIRARTYLYPVSHFKVV